MSEVLLDPTFLSALGHPVRLAALVLFERRPSSARELAEHVGLKPDAARHHVRTLDRAGLLRVVETRVRRGQEESVYAPRVQGWAKLDAQLRRMAEPTA